MAVDQPPITETLDFDDYQCRDVYAQYGLAMYMAQVLEHEIVNLLTAIALVARKPRTRADVDQIFDERFKQTLGPLITDLRAVLPVDASLEERLRDALALRNLLAHRYFRLRAESWYERDRAAQMIAELKRYRETFDSLQRDLEPLTLDLLSRAGAPVHRLPEEMLSMQQRAASIKCDPIPPAVPPQS